MKRLARLVCAATVCAGALAVQPSAVAGGVDVGVSVQISQPGVWGRVDIGRFPQPAVVLPQPVLVMPPPPPRRPPGVVVVAPPPPPPLPVYMWVPPREQKHWRRYCARYGACGVPVYFVRDDWYARHVQPRARWQDARREHWRDRDDARWRGRGDGRGRDRDDDHGHRRGHDRD